MTFPRGTLGCLPAAECGSDCTCRGTRKFKCVACDDAGCEFCPKADTATEPQGTDVRAPKIMQEWGGNALARAFC